MKKILSLSIIVSISCLIGYLYYNSQIETAYYRVSIYPPTSYDRNPKVEIHETPQYENDSIAINIEEHIYQYMQEHDEKKRIESIEKNHGIEDEVYKRWRDEQRIIMKLVHKRSFDVNELQELITKFGLRSYEVESYCKDNKVDMAIYPLLSKY